MVATAMETPRKLSQNETAPVPTYSPRDTLSLSLWERTDSSIREKANFYRIHDFTN